jgi:electron transport complex protein RnfE
MRKLIPESVRIPCYIVIIAGFVTIVDLLMQAFMPSLYEGVKTFIPLITVNCIILGRAEMFASKNSIGKSALDGIGMGTGFTLAIFMMATIREVLGAASFAGYNIPFLANYKIEFFAKTPGAMLVYGLMIALVYVITNGKAPKKKSFSCEGCPSASICCKGSCVGASTEAGKEEGANA